MNISDYVCIIILIYNKIILCFIYVKRYFISEDKEQKGKGEDIHRGLYRLISSIRLIRSERNGDSQRINRFYYLQDLCRQINYGHLQVHGERRPTCYSR